MTGGGEQRKWDKRQAAHTKSCAVPVADVKQFKSKQRDRQQANRREHSRTPGVPQGNPIRVYQPPKEDLER